MADPFSILAGSAGLADVLIRFSKFLREAKQGYSSVDSDLDDIFQEIASLHSVNELTRRSYKEVLSISFDSSHRNILENNWRVIQGSLSSCEQIIRKIESLLKEVLDTGSGRHVKLDQLRKWLKQHSREDQFIALRNRLKAHQNALQTSLTAIGLICSRASQASSSQSHSDLSRLIQDLGTDLESKIRSLEGVIQLSAENSLETTVESAQKVIHLASPNCHFYAPQTVSSLYTGRESELKELKHYLTIQVEIQKRFVIYGLAGSGKTQFCCKFASDNKQSFWGVFWIDASSREHAKQSFSVISNIGRVAHNQAAAKSWLSSLGQDRPWLLIIDNADDDESDFPVGECFPGGNAGTILITTRNPLLSTHGTIGPRYYQFSELEENKSIELLLNAANESTPWIPSSIDFASQIAKTLGYLPLALIHAGKAIFSQMCTLETYLERFHKDWAQIREREIKDEDAASSISDTNTTIYSSYEQLHQSIVAKNTQASKDALDMLRIFAFLHGQRIPLDIFLRAASNPKVESEEQKRKEDEDKMYCTDSRPSLTWGQTLKHYGIRMHSFLVELGSCPALPKFILDSLTSETFDDMRLRRALKELFQMSLISINSDSKDCYSMHPVVHSWLRKRKEMDLGKQAVWCQVAANVLSRAILLPPLGDTEEEEIFRRDILLHVDHIQKVEENITAMFLKNQKTRRHPWPVLKHRLDRNRILQLVKFSVVYMQGGWLEEAEKIQRFVLGFVIANLGVEHTATMDIMLLLSRTCWLLIRGEDAAQLQKQALDASIRVRGQLDLKTLKIMDAYGSTLWQQGKVPEACKVNKASLEGFIEVYGRNHVDTWRAMGNFARAIGKNFDFTEAIKLHTEALDGLKAKLGPSHSDTLIAMDNLAMSHFDRVAYGYGETGDLHYALTLESEVFRLRTDKLGKEHIFTLWSGLNLARIKAIRGETDEALSIFLRGHEISRRNFTESHFVYLFGQLHYGRILMCANRYKEAETILQTVVDAHKEHRKSHPDRLMALVSLVKCRNVLEKKDQTDALLQELIEGTSKLFGTDHLAVQRLLDPKTLSKEARDVWDQSYLIDINPG